MRIGPTQISSENVSFVDAPPLWNFSRSTLFKMRECAQKKEPDFFVWVFHKIWTWLSSWFKKPEPKAIECFKVDDSDGKIKYRLIKNGKKTENEIEFAKQGVILEGITFSEEMESHLPKMLEEVMHEEKITSMKTVNFQWAKCLWKCGLKTENTIPIKSSDKPVIDILKKAMQQRTLLDPKAKESLERVELAISQSLLSDAIAPGTGSFDKVGATSSFSLLKSQLGESWIIPEIEGQSASLQSIRASMADTMEVDKVVEFEIPLQDLFVLIDAIKTPMWPMHIPAITFTT